MEFRPVAALIKEKEVKFFKELIEAFREKLPNIIITPLKYGTIGDDTLVSFKVSDNHHKTILEKLIINNVKIISKDKETEKLLSDAQKGILPTEDSGWSQVKKGKSTDNSKSVESLDVHIKNGNYQEVINFSIRYRCCY